MAWNRMSAPHPANVQYDEGHHDHSAQGHDHG